MQQFLRVIPSFVDVHFWYSHPIYKKLIACGKPAIPFLLKDLRNNPLKWFQALHEISGENPIPDQDAGRVKKMIDLWLAWGKGKGYIDEEDISTGEISSCE